MKRADGGTTLRGFDLFAGMNEEELKALDWISHMVRVKKGQLLFLIRRREVLEHL